jgi:hypothetical protein
MYVSLSGHAIVAVGLCPSFYFFSFFLFSLFFLNWARNSCCWFVPVILFFLRLPFFFSLVSISLCCGHAIVAVGLCPSFFLHFSCFSFGPQSCGRIPNLIYCFSFSLLFSEHSPESACHTFLCQSPPRHEHAVDRLKVRLTTRTGGLLCRPFLNANPMIDMGAVV